MTYTELKKKFKECEKNWEENLKEESYQEISWAWPHKTSAQKEGMRLMVDYFSCNLYDSLEFDLEEQELEYDDKLFYCISIDEKIQLVQKRLEELKDFFFANKSNFHILPSSFPEGICHTRFPHMVFNKLPEDIQNKIIDLAPKDQRDWFVTVEILIYEFHNVVFTVIEFLYLKSLFQDLQIEKRNQKDFKIPPPKQENEYPEIFQNVYSYNLINYIIEDQQKKGVNMGPAFLTKLFIYFKDERFIFKKVKSVSYRRFLEKKHDIELKKLDERAVPDTLDIHTFDELKKFFKLSNNTES